MPRFFIKTLEMRIFFRRKGKKENRITKAKTWIEESRLKND